FRRNDGTVHIYYEDFLQNQILPVFISENTPVNITLYEPTLYDSIRWLVGGDSNSQTRDDGLVSGNHGETLTVNADLFHHEFGIHFIVVKVHVDGVEYSKIITVEMGLDPLPSSAWGFENQGGAD
ncbi:MAG: hypothetical protein FWD88_03660, partial [Treponema sp.]|nr:hypothetical protein [Treponema sp.]